MRHSISTFCFKFLMVYSAKHREYQLVAKSTFPCFLTRIFTMSVFPLWYAPAVPPELGGGTTQIWGHDKKNFRREFVPPTSKPCRRLCKAEKWSPIDWAVVIRVLTSARAVCSSHLANLLRRRVANPDSKENWIRA